MKLLKKKITLIHHQLKTRAIKKNYNKQKNKIVIKIKKLKSHKNK